MLSQSIEKDIKSYLDAHYPAEMQEFKKAYKFLLSDLYYGSDGLGDMPEDYSFTKYCAIADDANISLEDDEMVEDINEKYGYSFRLNDIDWMELTDSTIYLQTTVNIK